MLSAATGRLMAANEPWHLGIGDPDAIAWCIVGAYAVAVGASVWALVTARRGRRRVASIDLRESGNQRLLARLWLVVTVVMLALGINKQLDLQTWLVQTMRRQAHEGGWYDDRRRYQADFIAFVLVAGLATAGVLAYVLRRVLSRVRIAIAGLFTLVVFVAIRAASFHEVDRFLAIGAKVRINVILELGGIGLVAAGALHWHRSERERLEALCRPVPSSPRSSAWPQPEPASTTT